MKEIDLTARTEEDTKERLFAAAEAIRGGGLVVLPTMTFYALSADALNPDALRRVFTAKQRDPAKPLIALVDSFEMMRPLVTAVPDAAKELEWRLGRGGLSYVLGARDGLPTELTAGTGTVAVRIERNEIVQELLGMVGQPIVAPSANIEGRPPARNVDEALAQLKDWVDVAVRWYPSTAAEPSTIVDLTGEKYSVLREGAVPASSIAEVLGPGS